MSEGQVCVRCVMDTSDPDIVFDGAGVCNHCLSFESTQRASLDAHDENRLRLEGIVARIKHDGVGRPHDCVIGLSGGVDSSYVAWKAVELGLRPLAVHVDGGWNSELAVNNIENIVNKLGIELETVVVDWDEMRDLQLAFFKSGVSNCDIPQDHAFVAATYRMALSRGIRHILSGVNIATEYISARWGHSFGDLRHLKAIHARHGARQLKYYPTFNFFQIALWWPHVRGVRETQLLNYLPYVKVDAKQLLIDHLGWRDYGGKHYESVFTKFYQAYYLPVKFGYDKRRIHLSNLILSGQMTRTDAMAELSEELYPPRKLTEDKQFVAKKLGLGVEEFERLLQAAPHSHGEYPTNTSLVRNYQLTTAWIKKHLMPAKRAA